MGKAVKRDEFVIVQDTREQSPLTELMELDGYTVVVGGLKTGDYSVQGFEDVVAVERKSLNDLIQSITFSRKRFEAELLRGYSLERFAVVVESPWINVMNGKYRSKMNPKAATNSIRAFEWRYRCRFYFCSDRIAAARMVSSLLYMFISDNNRGKRIL